MTIVPDTKDWTWVLRRPCEECGFNASEVTVDAVPELAVSAAQSLANTVDRRDFTVRPATTIWSPLEYAAHVRDVCRIFDYRLSVLLTGLGNPPDVPAFDPAVGLQDSELVLSNWDQDATALASDYRSQHPHLVVQQLESSARTIADSFARVSEADRSRSARRSDGALFTVTTLAQYFLHDLVHHVHDVVVRPVR